MEEQERRPQINPKDQEEQKQKQNKDPYYDPPRLPKTWRERIFHSLSSYTGPYSVGYLEVELPVDKASQAFAPRKYKRYDKHALQLETVLFSIYYPTTTFTAGSNKSSRGKIKKKFAATVNTNTKTSAATAKGKEGGEVEEEGTASSTEPLRRVPWLPRPRVLTCHGYAKFLGAPNGPVTAYMASTCMWTKLPAFRNAKLAAGRPLSSSSSSSISGQVGNEEVAEDREKDKPLMFPVVMFSHGLGGSRTMYSTVCGDMASYGFVVVAMEHRDGSGARTYVNVPPERESPESSPKSTSESDLMKKKTANSGGAGKEEDKKPKRTENYLVDYIFPKDNPMDTDPQNEKGPDHELRHAQIEMRVSEIQEAFKVLELINAGDPENKIKSRNLRKKPNRGSSSKGLDGVEWADWKGRLSLENVTAMGHSFGGATTIQILRLNDRFPWIGQGILLDAWGPATPEAEPGSEQTITKPLLSIGSEAFMHWEANYKKMAEVCAEAKQGSGGLCWMLTVRGSTHLSQTDFAVLYPRFMSLFIKTLVNPVRGMYLTIAPSLEFLKIALPPAQTTAYGTSGWADEGLLLGRSRPDSNVTHDHKPDEKWTAARLKVNHELHRRAFMWWNEASTGWRKGSKVPESVPKDQKGRPLFGLGGWGLGEEIWVHVCPNKAEVEKHVGIEPEDGDGERPYPMVSGMSGPIGDSVDDDAVSSS